MYNYDVAPPLYIASYLYIYILTCTYLHTVKFRLVINSQNIYNSRLFAYKRQCSKSVKQENSVIK